MLIGQNVGPFHVEKELGCGAMGTVYLADYTKTGRKVALKVISPGLSDNEKLMERFDREVNILKQLKHPNIVRLLAFGRFHGSPFYAMEFIDGESLDQVLRRRGRFSWEEVVEMGKQVAQALQHAHENGVIHRDLKPSNLMFDRATNTVKLTDFGIAKDVDRTSITTEHKTIGTIAYMSPEQCQGLRNLTGKSDIYSLGIVLYELVTGRKPFEAENAMDMFLMHVQGKFERPSRLVPEIPMWLDTLICQCMEKKADHRPADAAMVAKALDEVKEKVASQESFSVRSAKKTAKTGKDARDREAAEALLEATGKPSRKRKRSELPEEEGRSSKGVWLTAAGLGTLLVLVIVLLVIGLWPASPADNLAAGEKLVQDAELLVDQGDLEGAHTRWIDAQDKYLLRVASDTDRDIAAKAKELLDRVKAGQLYRRGLKLMKEEPPKWEKANKEYWDELFRFPSENKHLAKYIDLARREMIQYEPKVLLEDAKKLAHPYDATGWPTALQKLERFRKRYPEHPKLDEVLTLEERLKIHQELLQALEAVQQGKMPNVPLDPEAKTAHDRALLALRLEAARNTEEARKAWKQLKDFGDQPKLGKPRWREPQVRPYYELAVAKLEAK
jgi:serine/threonine protein kinase/outer membrane protein assembly factor BamD (BamD/ComL family)